VSAKPATRPGLEREGDRLMEEHQSPPVCNACYDDALYLIALDQTGHLIPCIQVVSRSDIKLTFVQQQ
jgi:hypothetical protein